MRYRILSYMSDCVFIIFIAIDEQCLVPLTHWDSDSLFLKQCKYILHTLELKDFALVLYPFCLYSYLTEKQIYIYPLINSFKNIYLPLNKIF